MSYAGMFPSEGEKTLSISRDPSRNAATAKVRRAKPKSRKIRWPVFLCGVVAGAFTGLAVLTSPLGRSSAVRAMVGTVHTLALALTHAVKH